ncbi:MAG TPA: FAD:protein FMN transferase, partial [Mycobacteriales bacterium]|nr:FAD:protein FMN transferase [Mycobacteriales bacterium]
MGRRTAVGVALDAAEQTGDDLDLTVGHTLAALGYNRDFDLVAPTDPATRLTVRRLVSWHDVRLDGRLLTVPPGVRLDLGATAKAWAADRAATLLAERLGCGVLVSLGGDIAVAGEPPGGGWRVRVQDVTGHPAEPPPGPSALVTLSYGGLATSTTMARRWQRGGRQLHHILDPRSGLPAPPVWRTVSVAAPTALAANVASTTAIIRGRAGTGWLAGQGWPSPAGRHRRHGADLGRLAGRGERGMTGPVLWYANRATGVVSLLLLTAVIVLGVLVSGHVRLPGLPRYVVTGLPQRVSAGCELPRRTHPRCRRGRVRRHRYGDRGGAVHLNVRTVLGWAGRGGRRPGAGAGHHQPAPPQVGLAVMAGGALAGLRGVPGRAAARRRGERRPAVRAAAAGAGRERRGRARCTGLPAARRTGPPPDCTAGPARQSGPPGRSPDHVVTSRGPVALCGHLSALWSPLGVACQREVTTT